MFHSAEIRWFLEGSAPPSIERWFDKSPLAVSKSARTDHYLFLPNCSTVGVKIREGLFEVKAQTTAPEVVEYPNGLRGSRGSWVKWSQPASVGPGEWDEDGDVWLPVTKHRRIRLFEVAEESAAEVSPKTLVDGPGCQLEFAKLEVEVPGTAIDLSWWSFCLEAFGHPDNVLNALDVAAAQEQFREIAKMLTLESSMSYPLWLANLMGKNAVE